jgi:hypothetical protein
VAPPVGSSDRSVRRSGRAPGGPVTGIIGGLQAVAGSSPVALPHSRSRSKGRISRSVLLRLGPGRPTNELPILRWRGVGARLPGRVSASESDTPQDGLSAEQVAKAGAVAEAFGGGLGAWHRVIGPQNWAPSAHRPASDAVCEHAPAPAGDRGQPAGGNSSRSKPLMRRDIPQCSLASSIRPSTIDREPARPATRSAPRKCRRILGTSAH